MSHSLHPLRPVTPNSNDNWAKQIKDFLEEMETVNTESALKPKNNLSFSELKEVYREALTVYNSKLSPEAKYDLIFSERISRKAPFDWCDPDTSYEEDVDAFMDAFKWYMGDESAEP